MLRAFLGAALSGLLMVGVAQAGDGIASDNTNTKKPTPKPAASTPAKPSKPGGAPPRPAGQTGGMPTRPGGQTGGMPTRPGGQGGAMPTRPGGQTGGMPTRPGGQGGAMPTRPGAGGPTRPTGQGTTPGSGPRPYGGPYGQGGRGAPTRNDPRGGAERRGDVRGRPGPHEYRYHGREMHRYHAEMYRYPHGYRYYAYRRGEYLPRVFLVDEYYLGDYTIYNLDPPPLGQRWVRYGPDALLIDIGTGQVLDTAYGVFEDGEEVSPPDESQGGQDQGYGPPPPPAPPAPQVAPDLAPEFAQGTFALGHGPTGGCILFYNDPSGQSRAALDQAWQGEDWNGVARAVIANGCETDIAYYLLGLSAEGLGLPEAANVYYRRAYELGTKITLNPFRQCRNWQNDGCRGVDVVSASNEGLTRTAPQGPR